MPEPGGVLKRPERDGADIPGHDVLGHRCPPVRLPCLRCTACLVTPSRSAICYGRPGTEVINYPAGAGRALLNCSWGPVALPVYLRFLQLPCKTAALHVVPDRRV
jgi:hypothetical protein